MLMWTMSDRAFPRSFSTMEGFGVHTFRMVDAEGQVALRQVPLQAGEGHPQPGLGGSPEGHGQGRRLQPARSLRGHRARRLPEMDDGRPGDRGGGRVLVRLRHPRSDQADPGGAGARQAARHADAQPQRRQLLRRDRAGRLLPQPHRARHRLHQRSAAAGPAVQLSRHAARRVLVRTSPNCRSTGR